MHLEMFKQAQIARRVLSVSMTIFTLLLAGCVGSSLEMESRGEIAIPYKVTALMRNKGVKGSDPVFIRIFKQESELEVWKKDAPAIMSS